MPKEDKCYTCLSVILLDSVVNIDKTYHLQRILQEYKQAPNKKKIMRTVTEELNLNEFDDESNQSNED